MDVNFNSYSVGPCTLTFGKKLTQEYQNKVHLISFTVHEIVKQIGSYPIAEVRQLPDRDSVIHYIVDPNAQKLIEMFHRYGSNTKAHFCPFSEGKLRSRFTPVLGENNLLTVYEDESKVYRKEILSFFKGDRLRNLQVEWRKITKEWLNQLQNKDVNLFEASHNLTGKCLIQGMLGYSESREEDVVFNADFWRQSFASSPEELKTLKELEAEKAPEVWPIFRIPQEFLTPYVKSMIPYIKSFVSLFYQNDSTDALTKFHKLADSIYESTIMKKESLCYHLKDKGFDKTKIIENVRLFLLAGQETVGYLLGFILYEYANHLKMQDKHAFDKDDTGIKNAYLETLRLYSVGGTLREADVDMVLSYSDSNGQTKEHYIRKGDRLNCMPLLDGHNPAEWTNPEQFDCERPDLQKVKNNPHFGHGPHRCVGEKTAELEIMTILREILSNARIKCNEALPDLLDTFTIRPKYDIKVRFEII